MHGITLRLLLCFALVSSPISGLTASEQPSTQSLSRMALRIPAEGKVAFSGMVNHDAAGFGAGGGMLYPAFGIASFFAGVIAHGLINEGAKKQQKNSLQTEADKVLLPHRESLDQFQHTELLQRVKPSLNPARELRLLTATEKPVNEWLIDVAPLFQVAQDHSAVILDSAIAIYAPGSSEGTKPVYANVVRVVSAPMTGEETLKKLSDGNSEALKALSAKLLADSIEIALTNWTAGEIKTDVSKKTLRYMQGSVEKIERAEMLEDRCDRFLIRTLRGTLLSVPVAPQAQAVECGQTAVPGTAVITSSTTTAETTKEKAPLDAPSIVAPGK
jgi:hypothetical protein